jgi:hypothetical protein
VRLSFTIEYGVLYLAKFMNLSSALAGVLLLANMFLEHLLLFNFFNRFMCHAFAFSGSNQRDLHNYY